ncbi:SRPBCC family protein [Chitinimonas sp.]|uniref:SRPBCC family protein n=1 Tax=Chitinimonas sp. TaxID=1934313 RepID=UPI0035B05812
MRLFRRAVLAMFCLVLLLVGVGFLLPRHFSISRSTVIQAPAERIYAELEYPKAWRSWSVWPRRDPAMKISYSGAEHGVNARWSWESKTEGSGSMTFTASDPGRQLVYKLEFPEFGMVSTGSLSLEPVAGGSKLSWTNEGDMGINPLSRYMGLMMDRMVGPDFEGGLSNLKQQLEKPAS